MPDIKRQPGLRGACLLYLFLWKKRSKTRREKGLVDASAPTVGSTVAALTAGWQEMNYIPTKHQGFKAGRGNCDSKPDTASRLLLCRGRCSLEKVNWARNCTPACYRNEL